MHAAPPFYNFCYVWGSFSANKLAVGYFLCLFFAGLVLIPTKWRTGTAIDRTTRLLLPHMGLCMFAELSQVALGH